MIETEDGRVISEHEYRIIEQVRKLRPNDKVIVAKDRSGKRVVWTVIRQDQAEYDIL